MQKFLSILLLLICLQSFAQSKQNTILDRLLTAVNKRKLDTIKIMLLKDISYTYCKINDLKKMQAYNDSILYYAQKIKYKTGIAMHYQANTDYYRAKQDYTNAIYNITKARNLFYESKNRKFFFTATSQLINFLTMTGKYDEAQKISLSTLEYAQSLNDKSNMAMLYNKLGLTYYFKTSYDKAIQYYKKALILASKTPTNNNVLAETHLNLSHIYASQGQLNKALQNIDLSISYDGNDELNKLRKLQQKSVIMGNMGLNDEALLIYLQIGDLIKKNGLTGRKEDFDNKFLLGCNYYMLGKFNQAIEYLTSVKDNYTFKDEQMSQVLIYLATSYMGIDKLDEANTIFNILLSKIDTFSDEVKMQIYRTKHDLDFKLKNYESALNYYSLYYKTKDKLDEKLKDQEIQKLQVDFQVASKDIKIQKLKVTQLKNEKDLEKKTNTIIAIDQKLKDQQIQKLQVDFQVASKDIKIQKLKLNQLKNQTELENKRVVIASLIILLATLFISSFFIFRAFRTIKKKNKIIIDKSNTLEHTKGLVEKSLVEKEILLKEIHHRVKNNLQLIISLLRIQATDTKNNSIQEFIDVSQSRISSMALIHQSLYQSNNFGEINFKNYIDNLTTEIQNTFTNAEKKVHINNTMMPIHFDIQLSIILGLIINELVINAYKHAFETYENAVIQLQLTTEKDICTLTIADNGTGFKQQNETKSIGLQLIDQLIFQLRATMEIDNNHGTKYSIQFKI
jgi:two-component system, sensor histidine kinase PdtaS